MDTNPHRFTNTTCELDMAMEDHMLNDHILFDAFWSNTTLLQNHHHHIPSSTSQLPAPSFVSYQTANHRVEEEEPEEEEPKEELGAMKEMIFKIAAMQPVDIDPATIRKPKRRNVRISDDPQSVAARHRRERISEKMRILQRLVPGGTKMDTASMLDEAIRYVKFLKRQIRQLQANHPPSLGFLTCPPTEDWVITSTKALGCTTSSSMVEATCTVGSNRAADPMCLNNNNEVIGD